MIYKFYLLSFCIFFNTQSKSQNGISIGKLLHHQNDYPLDFRSFAASELEFHLHNVKVYEVGMICEDEFSNKDGIKLIKSYYCTTIMAAKGKGFENYVHYIKGLKSFSPRVYQDVLDHLKIDSLTQSDSGVWESIEIDSLTEEKQKELINETILLGGLEGNGCLNYTYGNCYNINGEYFLTFREYPNINRSKRFGIIMFKKKN